MRAHVHERMLALALKLAMAGAAPWKDNQVGLSTSVASMHAHM